MKKRSEESRQLFKNRKNRSRRRNPGSDPKKRSRIAWAVLGVCFVIFAAAIIAQKAGVFDEGSPERSSVLFPKIIINENRIESDIQTEYEVAVTEIASEETKVESTEDTTLLGLKEGTGKGYLNRCVFLGDSRTVALVNNALINDDAALAQIGISHPSFKSNTFINNAGKEYTLKSYLASHQSPVIYIALGVNGINDPNEEHYKSTFEDLVDTVIGQAPNSNIVLMSIGPVNDNGSYKKTVQNAWIEKYNAFLLELAKEKQIFYLNVSEILTDDNGQVRPDYDAGDGLHYSARGCEAIMDYIVDHPVPGIEDDGEYVVHYIKPNRANVKVTMDEGSGIDESVLEELMNMMVENVTPVPVPDPALNPVPQPEGTDQQQLLQEGQEQVNEQVNEHTEEAVEHREEENTEQHEEPTQEEEREEEHSEPEPEEEHEEHEEREEEE